MNRKWIKTDLTKSKVTKLKAENNGDNSQSGLDFIKVNGEILFRVFKYLSMDFVTFEIEEEIDHRVSDIERVFN